MAIANLVAEITGARVTDIISGSPRASLYSMKKNGGNIDRDVFNYTVSGKIPDKAIILDTVFDTGRTISVVSKTLGSDSVLAIVHSHVNKNINAHVNIIPKVDGSYSGPSLKL